ncbi:MAG TPA: thioredoxin fold domain-containing protein [Chitinophaga sp.]|uniref:thioredoxin family protein n=1 Tax=Chitinophaga sp. TaxID=1869181 RepID=UPI002C7749CD|nr:thioredoxin fold domain-containing protein [Chitinophaga sp.]HVI45179.1 thioredoxin fold domain-containing protein [Chitinophaga sp.]
MKRALLLVLLLPLFAIAQDKGMHFEHGQSWKDILAKAKAENKYIFVDCFTTWCGPCKYMSAQIFPQEEVGNFMNARFLNVKVQMDRTDKDNEEVKKWYDDAKMIEEKYGIRAYPTFLVFAPDGHAIDRQVGGADAQGFIARCEESLKPETQYYTQMAVYSNGKKDPAFVKSLAQLAQKKYDMKAAATLSKEYLSQQKDLYTPENLQFINDFTMSSKDQGFAMFLNNADKVNKVLGPGKAEKKVMAIVSQEEIFPQLMKKDQSAPDWNAIDKSITAKYPKLAEEMLLKAKIQYYSYKQDADKAVANIVAYMKKYGHNANSQELNEYAWTIFEKCDDMKCIEQALDWSKRSFKDAEVPAYMDTYANLLFKSGKKADAITWEEKAMNKAGDTEKKNYEETLKKMKSEL